MTIKIVKYCLAIMLVTLTSLPLTFGLGYGESCVDAPDDCDKELFLQCSQDRTCRCMVDHFDNNGKCLANIDEKCETNSDCDEAKYLQCDGVNKKCICTEFHSPSEDGVRCLANLRERCVEDVECDRSKYLECNIWGSGPSDQRCGCMTNHEESSDARKCLGNFDDNCAMDSDCDHNKFLECFANDTITGICKCIKYHDVSTDKLKCLANLNERCSTTADCNELKYLQCNEPERKCECVTDHNVAADGRKCLANLNERCTLNDDCDGREKHLQCNEFGTCICMDGLSTTEKSKCRAALGARCEDTKPCDEDNFARCPDSGSSDPRLCECEPGMVKNGFGYCRLTFGSDCSTKPCDELRYLACNGTFNCACMSDHTEREENCLANAFETCDDETIFCDDFQFCQTNYCNCVPGTSGNGHGKCRAKLNAPCNVETPCDVGAVCTERGTSRFCQCHDGLYDSGDGRCRSLVGGTCDGVDRLCDNFADCGPDNKCTCKEGIPENDEGLCRVRLNEICGPNLPCERGAECYPLNSRCRCQLGTTQNEHGKCRVMSYEGTCDTDRPCDENLFLECEYERCWCNSDHFVSNTQCMSNLGEPCDDLEVVDRICNYFNGLKCESDKCVCDDGYEVASNTSCRSRSVNPETDAATTTYNIGLLILLISMSLLLTI